jgi:hypothetical protein
MDDVQKNAVTDYNAPSSEPFRLHLHYKFSPKATDDQSWEDWNLLLSFRYNCTCYSIWV